MYRLSITLALTTILFISCINDLNTEPEDDHDSMSIAEKVYRDKTSYKKVLAKCYASLSLTGQEGPAGNPDLSNVDDVYGSYIRLFFYLNVASTDEAFAKGNSNGINDITTMGWTPSTAVISMAYSRIFAIIGYCNEFLRQTTPAKLLYRGLNSDLDFVGEIEKYRNEVRFIRAFAYWVVVDAFGAAPFATENDPVDTSLPEQRSRTELFNFVLEELKDLENKLAEPKTNEYARVDKAALWLLMARLYLNAEVYTGTAHWAEALAYAELLIDSRSGYSLAPKYIYNFLADNQTSPEIIWPLSADGNHTKSYANSSFFILCQTSSAMRSDIDLGMTGWAIVWLRPDFSDRFLPSDTVCIRDVKAGNEGINQVDKRSLIYARGNKFIPDIVTSSFGKTGYAFVKWRNVTKTGANGSDENFADTDFPLFRLADAYLMAAEAALRIGGAGNRTKALAYLNEIRDRAYQSGKYGSAPGLPLTDTDLSLPYILDERSRELSWELTRRSDLIRFGQYTNGSYHWAWKGNVLAGKSMDKKYNLFPIPSSDLAANPRLKQNPDYK